MSSDSNFTMKVSGDESDGEQKKRRRHSSSTSLYSISIKKWLRINWDPEVLSDTDILLLDEKGMFVACKICDLYGKKVRNPILMKRAYASDR